MRFTDIFGIQDEVSKQVTARLRLRLNPAEQARLAKRHTTNPEAFSLRGGYRRQDGRTNH